MLRIDSYQSKNWEIEVAKEKSLVINIIVPNYLNFTGYNQSSGFTACGTDL